MFLGGVFNISKGVPGFHHDEVVLLVYVIAQAGVKFGINFTSCSENGKEIA